MQFVYTDNLIPRNNAIIACMQSALFRYTPTYGGCTLIFMLYLKECVCRIFSGRSSGGSSNLQRSGWFEPEWCSYRGWSYDFESGIKNVASEASEKFFYSAYWLLFPWGTRILTLCIVLFLFSVRYFLQYDLIMSDAAESTVFTTCKFQKMWMYQLLAKANCIFSLVLL